MFETGFVYEYWYLWARERDAGEESGRKSRPSCLLLRNERIPDLLFMFPVSTVATSQGRTAMAVPASECSKAGLKKPSWIYVDEFNVESASAPVDFSSLEPVGRFSDRFLNEVRNLALTEIRARKARLVKR